jgi:hypothetical protein
MDSDDRIEESCADTHGVKAVHSNRDIVGETMRTVSIVGMNGRLSLSPNAQVIRALSR